jgi:flagellar motility protein MotE (MotC chaperone)
LKSSTKVFLAALVFIKIFICVVFIFQLELGPLFSGTDAIAQEPSEIPARLPAPSPDTMDDNTINLELLVQKMNLLKEKEKDLEKRNAELIAFQAEIDKKVEMLSKLRNEIKSQMAQKEGIERQKIKHLIKAYSAMKPQSAADLIERLEKPFAIELLSQMKGESVGQILTYVEKEKAAKLVEGLAERK